MQQSTDFLTLEEWMLSKANKLHGHHTHNMGVHSCKATNIWLYDGREHACSSATISKGGAWERMSYGMYDETHQGFPRQALLAAPKG